MSNALRKNLKQRLEENKITAHALEKQLGLKFSAIYNILQGKSKKPSANLILNISQALGCSVEELLYNTLPKSTENQKPKKWIPALYIDALKKVEAILSERKIETSKEASLKIVDEVYVYSLDGNLPHADEQFANWLISRLLS